MYLKDAEPKRLPLSGFLVFVIQGKKVMDFSPLVKRQERTQNALYAKPGNGRQYRSLIWATQAYRPWSRPYFKTGDIFDVFVNKHLR